MADIKKLLTVMNKHDASDLYITVDSPPCYRVNGIVRPAGETELDEKTTYKLAYSLMNDKQQVEFDTKKEQNIALKVEGLGRYRVNIFMQRDAIGMVIRRIKTSIPTLEGLHLPDVLSKLSMSKNGLVLFVGATGSGKSTSLAAMIDYRNNNQAGHIITVEDPIEFIHPHKKSLVTQREVGMDTDSYQDALKNALRQAPDVILIGEIRDLETMEAAINFAETGHLCLATLHANNANQAIERIMNFFPSERHKQIYMQLSLNLRGIVGQRLIPATNGARVPAVEVMLGTPRIKDLIHKGDIKDIKEAMEKGAITGMQTFDMNLFDLYADGKISQDTALKYADSANNLRLKIKLTEDDTSAPNSLNAFTDKKKNQDSKNQDGKTMIKSSDIGFKKI